MPNSDERQRDQELGEVAGVHRQEGGEGYIWFGEGVDASDPASIDEVALSIFNRITDDRFVEYQKAYRERASS